MRIWLLLLPLFCSCAAQTVLVPVPTERGHKMVPIMRNSGDVAAIDYTYRSEHGSVSFYARGIDNSTATTALHEGIQGEIRAAVQPAIWGIAGGTALNSIFGGTVP